jgi:glycosyltransferase involved in cell wall biosynthesis
VLAGIPRRACGMSVDLLVVDDGSRDGTAAIAREHEARVIGHGRPRGLGAAVRTGLELAREEGYDAAVYLDADGEYDPADFETMLDPIARGRADYVTGSRFLGAPRIGMTWHRTLANRATSSLLGTLLHTVVSDGQTGYRAFSPRALQAARIRHDYNYAQVLTLSLWGAGIDAVEVPVSYRRRTSGRSFVSYPEYLARVAPAVWREWRTSRTARAASARPMAPASQYPQPPSGPNSGKTSSSGPNGASGRSVTNGPPAQRTST